MKARLVFSLLMAAAVVAFGQGSTPIKRGVLQGDLDGNGFSITNLSSIEAITIGIPEALSFDSLFVTNQITNAVLMPNHPVWADADHALSAPIPQGANLVYAGPTNGADAAPTFRALVPADIPAIPYVPESDGMATNLTVDGWANIAGVGFGTGSGAGFYWHIDEEGNLNLHDQGRGEDVFQAVLGQQTVRLPVHLQIDDPSAIAERVLILDGLKYVTSSPITTNELFALDGITGNIQDQLNARLRIFGVGGSVSVTNQSVTFGGNVIVATNFTTDGLLVSGDLTNSSLTGLRLVVTDSNNRFVSTATSSIVAETVTDETGTGPLVFGTSPTLESPLLVDPFFRNGNFVGTNAFEGVSLRRGSITTLANGPNMVDVLTNVSVVDLSGNTAAADIVGMRASVGDRLLVLRNASSFPHVFVHQSGLADATNRIRTLSGVNLTNVVGGSVLAVYHSIDQRWDMISLGGGGGGGGEANTAVNIGGGFGLFAQKNGVDLEFNTITGGPGINILSNANLLTISAATIPSHEVVTDEIDWSEGNVFKKVLEVNTTFTFSNEEDGKTIVVKVTNESGNSFTVTWPGNVLWPEGIAPNQSVNGRDDIYTFIHIGGTNYASYVQGFIP